MKRQRTSSGQYQRKQQREKGFSEALCTSLEWNFKKIFTYKIPELESWSFQLDDLFSSDTWQDEELLALKLRLNNVKSELSDTDITKWHSHTCDMNPAGVIVSRVREAGRPELCTQAWCKFHEILANFNTLVREHITAECLRSLHLCEAPGAFIASLNHYIKSRGGSCEWQWVANTLNPNYEGNNVYHMIADDKLILETPQNWFFGPDNSGDIMSYENLKALQKNYRTSKFHLVTADGSIDCADNPAEQESMTSGLHYCELVAALAVLSVGGNLVLKMFTLFEHTSVCTMYIMCTMFNKVSVFKPVSSKPGNSEVYVVCEGYRGVSEDVLNKLLQNTGSTDAILPETAILESFQRQHVSCCQTFADYQINTIRKNQSTFTPEGKDTDELKVKVMDSLKLEKECCAYMYIEKCGIQPVPFAEKLLRTKRKIAVHNLRSPREGSYTQRYESEQLPWQQRVSTMELFDVDNLATALTLKSCGDIPSVEEITDWCVISGRTLTRVESSRFCSEKLLSLYNKCLKYNQEQGVNDVSLHYQDPCSTSRLHVVSYSADMTESQLLVDQTVFHQCFTLLLEGLRRGDNLLLRTVIPLTRLYAGLISILHMFFYKIQVVASQNTSFPSMDILCDTFLYDRNKSTALHSNSDSSCEFSNSNKIAEDMSSISDDFHNKLGNPKGDESDQKTVNEDKSHVKVDAVNSGTKKCKWSNLIGYLQVVHRTMDDSRCEKTMGKQLLSFVPMLRLYESEFCENLCWMNDNLIKRRINYFIKLYSAKK